jgi:hypothetical protein
MENKKDVHAEMEAIMAGYMDYMGRFVAFQKEHQETIKEMMQRAQDEDYKIKPIDPQQLFETDALIKHVEDSGLEDDIEGFHKFKYTREIYYQFKEFVAEGRYYEKSIIDIQIQVQVRLLKSFEGWLKNAKKAIAEGKGKEGLPEAVEDMEKNITGIKNGVELLKLKLAAMQPYLSN